MNVISRLLELQYKPCSL